MKISQLEALVEQFIEEKLLGEKNMQIVTPTGTKKGATADQLKNIQSGDSVEYTTAQNAKKPSSTAMGEAKKSKEDEAPAEEPAAPVEPSPEEAPAPEGLESIKSELQSVVSKLESMEDFKIGDKEDLKAKKLMNKIKLKLDDVVLIMDDLAAIKSKLDEQKEVADQKAGDKYAAELQKMLKKRFKNPKDVESVMSKYNATAKKYKHLEPKKVEEAIVRHMLKENAQLEMNNDVSEGVSEDTVEKK
jgi:hypothetical protein